MNSDKTKYEIRVSGHLGHQWADWFEGMNVTQDFDVKGCPISILSGNITDQSALHGILAKIRDIGLSIISVNRVE